jgi:glycosyltransferase involved in cell wall biosynthesis
MRVCLIAGEFPPMQGGVGDYTSCLARAMAQMGNEVTVITSGRATPVADIHGVRVLAAVRRWDFECWPVISRILQETKAEVANIQYQAGAYQGHGAINLMPLRWRLAGKPLGAVTFHDLNAPYLFPKAGPLRQRSLRLMAQTCRVVITTNPEDAAALRMPSKLIPIGSNISPEPAANYDRLAQRAQWGVGPNDLLLAYFGFLTPSKGVETLMATLRLLRDGGWRVTLLMVGGMASDSVASDLSYAGKLRQEILASDLAPLIRWTGFTSADQVTANLLAADLCVLPFRDGASFRNGTLAAAIAHRLALVTTAQLHIAPQAEAAAEASGLRLQDGVNSRLVPPSDAPAMARAIAQLAGDAKLRAQLQAGMAELAKLTTWETIARQTLEAYQKALDTA